MKLLGLSCGRKMDNTEVVLKEALMAAEEAGAEVWFMRLQELDIKPCRGCAGCMRNLSEGGDGSCVIDDDLKILDEKVMDCDALILGSPVYTMTPTGQLKTVCDRFGPSHDVASRMEAKKSNAALGRRGGPDERSFKHRVGGFIAVGGGSKFVYMALPLMNLFTFPLNIKIVDQMLVAGVWYGNVILDEGAEFMERARRLGRNVAGAMRLPVDEVKWLGDEMGTCPVCHSDLLTVTNKNPVICPICGIKGELRSDGDDITVTFSEEEQRKSHLTLEGMLAHVLELRGYSQKAGEKMQLDRREIAKRLEKYEGYREIKLK